MCVCTYVRTYVYVRPRQVYVHTHSYKILLSYANQVTLSVVNTRSMSPAIQPRDIILVEKVTPVAKRLLLGSRVPVAEVGDVVFFREPTNMRRYIKAEGLPAVGNALLVKRVSKVVPASEKMDKNGVVRSILFLCCILVHGWTSKKGHNKGHKWPFSVCVNLKKDPNRHLSP